MKIFFYLTLICLFNCASDNMQSSAKENYIESTNTPSRTYHSGKRGGCYYLTSSGKKEYVDKSHCR